jgi:RimJ/RimL family protein N-acetyltransferase
MDGLLAAAPDKMEQITLSVVSGNTAAQAFYEAFGFTVFGVEPRSMKTDARYLDEVLMVRFLKPAV